MLRLSSLLLFILTISSDVTFSEEGNRIEFSIEHYTDNNGVVAQTPIANARAEALPSLFINDEQMVDGVSGASRFLSEDQKTNKQLAKEANRTSQQPLIDGFSGPSKIEIRYSQQFGLEYNKQGAILGGSYYSSFEDDYTSHSPSLYASFDFNQRNTTISVGYSRFFDRYKGREEFEDKVEKHSTRGA